jgi:hypothetical protein
MVVLQSGILLFLMRQTFVCSFMNYSLPYLKFVRRLYPKHNSQIMLLCIRSKRKKKKKIRRIIDDAELGEETKRKIAIEKVLFFLMIDLVKSVMSVLIMHCVVILCRNVKNA